MHRTHVLLAGLLVATAAMATAVYAAGSPMQGSFTSQVTVHPDGHAEMGAVEGVTGALQAAVRTQLQSMRFVPAKVGGVVMASNVQLEGTVRLTPSGSDDYLVTLANVRLMPAGLRLKTLTPPLYPPEMFRHDRDGFVELALRIGTDGRIKEATTVQRSDPAFETAVRSRMKPWRFEPLASEAVVSLPIWFYLERNKQPATLPAFKCSVPVEQAHVEGQSGCLDRIEVTAR